MSPHDTTWNFHLKKHNKSTTNFEDCSGSNLALQKLELSCSVALLALTRAPSLQRNYITVLSRTAGQISLIRKMYLWKSWESTNTNIFIQWTETTGLTKINWFNPRELSLTSYRMASHRQSRNEVNPTRPSSAGQRRRKEGKEECWDYWSFLTWERSHLIVLGKTVWSEGDAA